MLEKYKNKLVAHRGIHDNITIPENSLRSFKLALEKNFPIELDVHLTADNNIIIFHDHNLKRMTNESLVVESLTTEKLKKYKLLNTKETIPTLDETLKLINSKVLIIIEVKAINNNEQTIIKTLLEKLSNYTGEIIIQSFNPKVVKLLKNTKYISGLLISETTDIKKCKLLSKTSLDINYAKPNFLSISKKIINRKHIEKYLLKYPTLIWTIKKKDELKKYKNKDYIYICNNLPYEND